jgi:transcriptional regulator with XRE-family HTH domain
MPQQLDREKMKARRLELELNQTEAAERAGFKGGVAVWSSIERGDQPNVTLDTLAKIAAALECDARDLITPREKPKRKGK